MIVRILGEGQLEVADERCELVTASALKKPPVTPAPFIISLPTPRRSSALFVAGTDALNGTSVTLVHAGGAVGVLWFKGIELTPNMMTHGKRNKPR